MKNLSIIILLIVTSCTSPNNKLEGIWIVTAHQTEKEKKYKPLDEVLFDIDKDSIKTILIDNSYRDLRKRQVQSAHYQMNDSMLNIILNNDTMCFSIDLNRENAIIKTIEDSSSYQYYLTKLERSNYDFNELKGFLKGSFTISNVNFTDSIEFINDSLLIYTDENNLNFPVKKCELQSYEGVYYIHVLDPLFPLLIIQSYANNEMIVSGYYLEKENYAYKPYQSVNKKELLLGEWVEVSNSNPQPRFSPELNEFDKKMKLNFTPEFLDVNQYKNEFQLKWKMTKNGQRIYFPKYLMKAEGSWKILKLTKESLYIRRSRNGGFEEELIEFKRP